MLGRILIGAIRLYQTAISPWTPASCRYHPTCSAYARGAIEAHGAVRGSALAVRRLLRCHPWGGYGHDPVPESHPYGGPAEPRADRSTPDQTIQGKLQSRHPRVSGR